MKINTSIMNNLKESEHITIDPKIVKKVQAEYDKAKPEFIENIKKEFKEFEQELLQSGYFTKEELNDIPEVKAYKDAIKDPDDIWCSCNEYHDTEYKPDGEQYLGVTKHAYICKKCKKYVQIG